MIFTDGLYVVGSSKLIIIWIKNFICPTMGTWQFTEAYEKVRENTKSKKINNEMK